MKVLNVHERRLAATPDAVGELIDSLASSDDRLWPRKAWPSMRFDRPLGVGAVGGHGPIRYTVVEYLPGVCVRFRFDAPRGFHGTHRYEWEAVEGAVVLAHVLEMETRGLATVTWPIFYRPLHDALIEDSLAVAQRSLRLAPERHPWSVRVRALRRIVGRGRARSQSELFA
ncbi:MAG TPA: hypothetical protein VF139_19055 [Candidatus Polarisedimenticolaceae bacterium]